MNKAVEQWQKIFDRHAAILKQNPCMGEDRLKSELKTLIELVGLRWAMRPSGNVKEEKQPNLDDVLSPLKTSVIDLPEVSCKSRQGGEDVPWWDRKTRYIEFDLYLRDILKRAAEEKRIDLKLNKLSSRELLIKAFARLAKKPAIYVKVSSNQASKQVAASVLKMISPKLSLEKIDKSYGGLSLLLAMAENAIGLLE